MADLFKLVRIQVLLFILFAIFKFIRPTVLKSDTIEGIKVVLLSLPNFFEAFIGTLLLTGMGLYINAHFLSKKKKSNPISFT